VDQRSDRRGVETESLVRNVSNEFGTGLPRGIQKLFAGFVSVEVCFVFGCQKRRLVMIEPPSQIV
jgi:hypothetical protein